jgi:hypothetical protein
MSQDSDISDTEHQLAEPHPFCAISAGRRNLAPVDRNGHHAAFHNLVHLISTSAISDSVGNGSHVQDDDDESDDDHDASIPIPDASPYDADDSASSSDGSPSWVRGSSSNAAPFVPEATITSDESAYDYPDYAVTPLKSKGGIALTEGITLKILNILKSERQNKTLTNFQQASQYCYALAKPVIWTRLVVNVDQFVKVDVMEQDARNRISHWISEGSSLEDIPSASDRRIVKNYLIRERAVIVVFEAEGLEPAELIVRPKYVWK